MLLLGLALGAVAGYLLGRARAPAAGSAQANVDVLRGELAQGRRESAEAAAQLRHEVNVTLGGANAAVLERVEKLRESQEAKLAEIAKDARTEAKGLRQEAVEMISARLGELKTTVETLTLENEKSLEKMRATVDEKLQSTLEQRLGESFRQVSDRLEAVHQGLGEMQTLASGVGDLKKVLTNVKTRGTWGEGQLKNILDEVLTPEQYEQNVQVRPDSAERVEYAVKLPGRDADGEPVWLPIDSKFLLEDYQRLVEAAESGDAQAVAAAGQGFDKAIFTEAKRIREKYVHPPHTTDFGIMFLSTESLYAEVLRRPAIADKLRQDRIMIAGPTILAALLNSLQMGFRTLAIQRRSSEVWQVLGVVKAQFGKFADALSKVEEKLEQATKTVAEAKQRSRVMSGKLRDVEVLEEQKVLPGIEPTADGSEETQ